MADPPDNTGFLTRWSQRKVKVRSGLAPAEPEAAPVAGPGQAAALPAVSSAVPPGELNDEPGKPATPAALTLDDVDALTAQSDFSRFVRADVDGPVRNAALKKLFADPAFNVMDGLDTYIDDYGRPDPLSPAMLRKMVQSKFLGLFGEDADAGTTALHHPTPGDLPAPTQNPASMAPDEDPHLRLQPDDAAGRQGPEPGPGEDAGRQP